MAETIYRISRESWPIKGGFSISRGSKTTADVIRVELSRGGKPGQGECVPYGRYGETLEGVGAALETVRAEVEQGLDRKSLQILMSAGAARNALDCALWDLESKLTDVPVWQMAGLAEPKPVITAFTISLAPPEAMAAAAGAAANRPLLKVKLGGDGDIERIEAVREAAPKARLIVDANEAWSLAQIGEFTPRLAELGVEMIEQPLPAGEDAALASIDSAVPLCADESFHLAADLPEMAKRYDAVNIKLDKTGGLTEALELAARAHEMGLAIMVGCMVGTSLAMAPAALLAGAARYVDLDGPLLLERDRAPGMTYQGSVMYPPPRDLWG
jgi:L-alanine-DL-glutamate epimerase-like enolase superfamily enzyme